MNDHQKVTLKYLKPFHYSHKKKSKLFIDTQPKRQTQSEHQIKEPFTIEQDIF